MRLRQAHRVLGSVLAGTVIMITACSGDSPGELTLDAADDGSQIRIEQGQALTIALEGNPTTGYTWEVEEGEGEILRQAGDAEFEPDSQAIGSGGVQTFRFEAVQIGETSLELVYRRPWEENVAPIETFSVQVTVY